MLPTALCRPPASLCDGLRLSTVQAPAILSALLYACALGSRLER